jgi:hypothetical protein
VYIRSTPTLFQANSKFSQIEQSPANAEQNPSKKKAWISLDFLVGNEPFQWVALTPGAKKSFLSPSPPAAAIQAESSSRGRSDAAIQESWGARSTFQWMPRLTLAIDDRVTLHSATGPMYHDF